MKENYNTKQKSMIMDYIFNNKHEFTIKDIYNYFNGKIGLTTIYRFIDKMVSNKKIEKFIGIDNITYYQYLEECSNDNHFYLKCKICGDIIHVDCDCIKDLSGHISIEHQFKLSDNIIFDGICKKCIRSNQ